VIDPDAHPSGVLGDIVDAVGHGPAEFLDDEIMHPYLFGRTFGPPLAPAVLEIADQFLLLGVERDRRLTRSERFLLRSLT
jgi:hypothetical protein